MKVTRSDESVSRYHSVMDSEVNQGNMRYWAKMDSKASKKVWEIISTLCILGEGRKSVYEVEIRKMELIDKEGKSKREVEKSISQ